MTNRGKNPRRFGTSWECAGMAASLYALAVLRRFEEGSVVKSLSLLNLELGQRRLAGRYCGDSPTSCARGAQHFFASAISIRNVREVRRGAVDPRSEAVKFTTRARSAGLRLAALIQMNPQGESS